MSETTRICPVCWGSGAGPLGEYSPRAPMCGRCGGTGEIEPEPRAYPEDGPDPDLAAGDDPAIIDSVEQIAPGYWEALIRPAAGITARLHGATRAEAEEQAGAYWARMRKGRTA